MVSRTNKRRCMAEGWDGVVPVCEGKKLIQSVPETQGEMSLC